MISAGRLPSWLELSSQTFFTVADVFSGTCLFVSVVTVPAFAVPLSV